ncbi:hypothetical protein NBRC116584_37020 [Hydrogenophaga sp. 5NK40-0174]
MPGKTINENTVFITGLAGSVAGGVGGALAGDTTRDLQANMNMGQITGSNAVANNFLKHEEQKKYAEELNDCKGTGEAACKAIATAKYQGISDENNVELAKERVNCITSGSCGKYDKLMEDGTGFGEGYRDTDYQSDAHLDGETLNAENRAANDATFVELVNRPIEAEVRLFKSDDPLNSIPDHYQSEITARNQEKVITELAAEAAGALGEYVVVIGGKTVGKFIMDKGKQVFRPSKVAVETMSPGQLRALGDYADDLTRSLAPSSGSGPYSSNGLKYGEVSLTDAAGNAVPTGATVPATPAQAPTGQGLSVTFIDKDAGVRAVNPTDSVSRSSILRLSSQSESPLHEVRRAAHLENATGSTIRMLEPPTSKGARPKSPDFQFESGPYAGKTGDFMFTDTGAAKFINRNFEKNWPKTVESLNDHLGKADITFLDFGNLTVENQSKINKWISELPESKKSKLMIIR